MENANCVSNMVTLTIDCDKTDMEAAQLWSQLAVNP